MPADYDRDPSRFAAAQEATRRFAASDVYPGIADRLAEVGSRRVLDIGGGNGLLARELAGRGIETVVMDRAGHVRSAPRPAVRADAFRMPFGAESFDAAAAVMMLYHIDDPVAVLREAHRVLRPGGLMCVCTVSRDNDPEFAHVLPEWGRPMSFDAENGVEILGRVFEVAGVERWDEPLVHLPDRPALELYLRGRGLPEGSARSAAGTFEPPLSVTKRGMIAWGRKVG